MRLPGSESYTRHVPTLRSFESGTYGFCAERGKPGRKRLLPPRKRLLPGVAVLLAVGAGIGVVGAEATDTDFASMIQADAERAVQAYARRRGWVNYEYDVEAWVPGSADRQQACDQPVEVHRAEQSGRIWGRVPYVLSCLAPNWEIRARAEVSLRVPVVTARRTIRRGETLNNTTLALARRDLADIYGDFVTDSRLLAGKRARRAIRAGQVVTLDQAEAPLLVERGDNVVIRIAVDGVAASMLGEALQGGSLGQGIRVQNHSSGKVITAWIVEKGVVEVRF